MSVLEGIRTCWAREDGVNHSPDNEYGVAVEAAWSSDVAIGGGQRSHVRHPGLPAGDGLQCGSVHQALVRRMREEGRTRPPIARPASEDLDQGGGRGQSQHHRELISSFPLRHQLEPGAVPAILHITHAAQEQARPWRRLLFGAYNPAGRLVQTWPRGLDQLPALSDYDLRNGRTYLYFKGDPSHAFGHGLSQDEFPGTGPCAWKKAAVRAGETVVAEVTAPTPATPGRGEEVVQLYACHPGSKARPGKELKAFQRVAIPAGQSRTVQLEFPVEELAY
ncbi:MAG: glycoside hydrolase family 3 C-terminal domain-containing protein [Bacteroidales bacterium]